VSEARLGGREPNETLWWSLRFLIARADLPTLRDSRAKLVESATTRRARGEAEDEINSRVGGRSL